MASQSNGFPSRIWEGRCVCGYLATARGSSAAILALLAHEIYVHGLTRPRVEQTVTPRERPA